MFGHNDGQTRRRGGLMRDRFATWDVPLAIVWAFY
jgi:hypothetical protein